MTKTQLARLRARTGLNKAEFAALVQVDPATITRWEAGTVEIPAICAIAIEAMVTKHEGEKA